MPSPLRRSMRLRHALAMVVGVILGASVFIQASEITRHVPSIRGVMLAWLAAGALTLCGALVCAELSATFPETGGVYVFLSRLFSPAVGFLWGWAMFWSVHSGIIAAIAVILARYLVYFIPGGEFTVRLLAIAAIILLSAINYLGVKLGGGVQVFLTAAKMAAIVLLLVLLFWVGGSAHHGMPPESAVAQKSSLGAFGLAVAAGLFAFGGWHMVTYSSGETVNPERTIPKALLWGTLIVTACYMLLNAGYHYVLPLHEVARSTHVAADAMARVLGPRAAAIIAVLVVLSALGALNGIILAGPRVYYAMAQDKLAFRWMGAVHPVRQTPHLAIAAQGVWSCVLVATNSYNALFSRVVYTEWVFFALLAVGLFLLRRRADYRPKVLSGGYQPVAVLFILASVAIAVNQYLANPRDNAMGLGLLLLGVPVYFVWSRNRVIARVRVIQ